MVPRARSARSRRPDHTGETTRRSFLARVGTSAGVGAIASGTLGSLAGCISLGARGSDDDPVRILAAGSLQRTFGEGLREAVDVPVTVEAHGSVTAARLVAGGQRDPDIVVLADTALFDSIVDAPWYATIATNALVLAHTDQSDPHPVAAADRWFDPILDGSVSLGRTDPALDPLGYRTVLAADLAERFYDRPGLREELLDSSSIYPETSLVSRLEAGVVDAAVVYRNMAVEREYPTVDLPAAIDLGDPTQDYSDATYELDENTTVRGAPIRYGAWVRSTDSRVQQVFDTILDGAVLNTNGFGTADPLPRFHGSVPEAFEV